MTTFAGALGRGLAGYAANRQQADDREYEREQQRLAREQAERRERMNGDMMRAQIDTMRSSAERSGRELQLREADATMRAADNGYRPVSQSNRDATQIRSAAPAMGDLGPFPALMTMSAKMMAGGLQRASESPAFQIGQEAYAKTRDSKAETAAKAQRDAVVKNDERERIRRSGMLASLPAHVRSMAEGMDTQSLEGVMGQQIGRATAPPPRESAPSYQVLQTPDGPVVMNSRNPNDVKPLMVNGARVQPPATKRTSADFTAARQLRGEYEKIIAPHRGIASALTDLTASISAPPSAQGDIALVYKFMRALDPTSTVREGEFASAKNAGGVSDRVRNAYNSALNGQFLTPQQRTEMLKVAQSRAAAMRPQLQREMTRYSGMAEKYGVDAADVVFDPYGEAEDAAPLPSSGILTPRTSAPQRSAPPTGQRPPLSSYEARR
jgi:hypothetical protein